MRPGHRGAARRRGQAVRGRDERAAGRDRGAPRRGRHRPPAEDPVEPAARPREAGRASASRRPSATRSPSASGSATPSLWGGPGVPEIEDRLGWLTVVEAMLEQAPVIDAFVREVRDEGFTDAVLLGHGRLLARPGGASAAPSETCPTACACTCSTRRTRTRCCAVQESIDLEKTLFIVSSKSGGTIETLSHFTALPRRRPRRLASSSRSPTRAARSRSSPREHGFRRVFQADPDIGGRYSGAVVLRARAGGADGRRRRGAARSAPGRRADVRRATTRASELRPVARLRARRARAARAATSSRSSSTRRSTSFGLWVEQLVAESTGKQGRGHPAGRRRAARRPPTAYGDDRVFVHLRDADDAGRSAGRRVDALASAGHPVHHARRARRRPTSAGSSSSPSSPSRSPAGCSRSTRSTSPTCRRPRTTPKRVLDVRREPRARAPATSAARAARRRRRRRATSRSWATCRPSDEFDAAVAELRARDPRRHGAATTFGYGPRFLHSTGPVPQGRPADRPLPAARRTTPTRTSRSPGAGYTFGTLTRAQAIGDLQTLRAHGLPAERVRARRATRAARCATSPRRDHRRCC